MSEVVSASDTSAPPAVADTAVVVPVASEDNRVWIDCEMTNLDLKDPRSQLVEIAVIVTDKDLNILAEGPDIVIHQTEEVLEGMSEWCKENFEKSGLLSQIRDSKVSMKEAEQQIIDFIKPWTIEKKNKLHGNSIYMDRMFIKKDMSDLDQYLHYRLVDVSTVKELTYAWYPQEFENQPRKTYAHRALSDIRESIAELQYYRTAVFKQSTGVESSTAVESDPAGSVAGEKRSLSESTSTDTATTEAK